MKRTPLRRQSSGKARWNRLYAAALRKAKAAQIADRGHNWCERCERTGPVEGHHTGGRSGEAILRFRLVCQPCHTGPDGIHQNPKRARAEGWLA